jgi:hypothetical protein
VKVIVMVEKPIIQVPETNQICNHKCDCQKRKRKKKKKRKKTLTSDQIPPYVTIKLKRRKKRK